MHGWEEKPTDAEVAAANQAAAAPAAAAAAAERARARARARAEDASRALEMIEATVDGKLESFNGVPIGAIRRADLAQVECDLRHSGPEAGTTIHLSTELPSYRATLLPIYLST